jgi:radical SAM superfamily enzyme YgiQ (UPF0313 family)
MLTYPTLQYDEPLYRPPSEGRNLIIQATIGCSFNRCTFCSMYKSKMFRARPLADVFADIEAAARIWPNAPRIFLADGDALVLSPDALAAILDKLAAAFPALERVSCYATPINLMHKSAPSSAVCARKSFRSSMSGSNRAPPRCSIASARAPHP